jgi:hypothetical protein
VLSSNLTAGKSRSCGCLRDEQTIKRSTVHGMAHRERRDPAYKCWAGMRSRCLNQRHADYADYGGRGITVCEAWSSFAQFVSDMGPRPGSDRSIERKDVNGNYCPDNCIWGTVEEQASNKRNSVFLVFNGERATLSQWARRVGIHVSSLAERVQRHGPEKALSLEWRRT